MIFVTLNIQLYSRGMLSASRMLLVAWHTRVSLSALQEWSGDVDSQGLMDPQCQRPLQNALHCCVLCGHSLLFYSSVHLTIIATLLDKFCCNLYWGKCVGVLKHLVPLRDPYCCHQNVTLSNTCCICDRTCYNTRILKQKRIFILSDPSVGIYTN